MAIVHQCIRDAPRLGLQRGTVQLIAHSAEWITLFAEERERLLEILGERVVDIQHMGSTAVPGLDAKPILDIAVGLIHLADVSECVPLLENAGYSYFGDRGAKGDFFFAKGEEKKRTHYLHAVEYSGSEWNSCLLFRDHLLANRIARQRYSLLKHTLSAQFANDREAYTNGKVVLIETLLREAAEAGGGRRNDG